MTAGRALPILAAIAAASALLARAEAVRRDIPEGKYLNPFLAGAPKDSARVPAFRLDERAVTTSEFLAFTRAHPEWRKSKAKRLFADSLYLGSWKSDDAPPRGRLAEPVTEVSWFAAKAYCDAAQGRLPATDEWERVAAALPLGQDSSARNALILDWYARPAADRIAPGKGSRDAYGVNGLLGKVWEWTADFDSGMPSGPAAKAFCGGAGQATALGASYALYMRYSFRSSLKPDYNVGSLGFRCAEGGAP